MRARAKVLIGGFLLLTLFLSSCATLSSSAKHTQKQQCYIISRFKIPTDGILPYAAKKHAIRYSVQKKGTKYRLFYTIPAGRLPKLTFTVVFDYADFVFSDSFSTYEIIEIDKSISTNPITALALAELDDCTVTIKFNFTQEQLKYFQNFKSKYSRACFTKGVNALKVAFLTDYLLITNPAVNKYEYCITMQPFTVDYAHLPYWQKYAIDTCYVQYFAFGDYYPF